MAIDREHNTCSSTARATRHDTTRPITAPRIEMNTPRSNTRTPCKTTWTPSPEVTRNRYRRDLHHGTGETSDIIDWLPPCNCHGFSSRILGRVKVRPLNIFLRDMRSMRFAAPCGSQVFVVCCTYLLQIYYTLSPR